MISVFLAPTLQPETQSPHIVQGCCVTPTWFGPSTVKFTVIDAIVANTPGYSAFLPECFNTMRAVDGVVFVADSQWEKMEENVESFRNLEENLREYNYSLDEMPYVIQYNKRDLANVAPIEYLEFMLNRRARRVPYFEAVAVNGDGVFDTLNTVSRMVLVGEFGQEKGEHRETA